MGISGSCCSQSNVKVGQYPPELSDKERKLIQQSWSLSEQSGYENSGQRIFNKIFSIQPELEPIFTAADKPSDVVEHVENKQIR